MTSIRALLVGINQYKSTRIKNLRGCVNDVNALGALLHSKFEVDPTDVITLRNGEATREAILDTFRSHLIEHAKKNRKSADEPEPAYLYYFSGHGSEARARSESPNQRIETTVPSDRGTRGIFDIKDWELGQLIDELASVYSNVTVILDCCHSGHGTRKLGFEKEVGTFVEEEQEIVPTETAIRGCDPDEEEPESETAGPAELKLALVKNHVLLAGCRHNQLSRETAFRDNDGTLTRHGVMTYYLIQELARMSPERVLTYTEVHQLLKERVGRLFTEQTPQCEGDLKRELFGGARPATDVFYQVEDKGEDPYVAGGIVHGIRFGAQLEVYPPETRLTAEAQKVLGRLEVESAGPHRSKCSWLEAPVSELTPDAKAALIQAGRSNQVLAVSLLIKDPEVEKQLRKWLAKEESANYFDIVGNGEPGFFRIVQAVIEGPVEIQDGTGRKLIASFDPAEPQGIVDDLCHMGRYHNLLDLENDDLRSRLADAIGLKIVSQRFDGEGEAIKEDGRSVFEPIENGKSELPQIQSGIRLALEIENRSDLELNVYVLSLDCAYAVGMVYPGRGVHKIVSPRTKFVHGEREKESEQKAVAFGLPEGWPYAREYLKVIASAKEIDCTVLEQGKLRSPYRTAGLKHGNLSSLQKLLHGTMAGFRLAQDEAQESYNSQDDWTTASVTYQLIG